ncbi:uncharacterized protein LOC132739934 isoform X1 [Ruditapes philippinarum]|uniref:uncharacterized protein LOC132739934 isoform X1 n=1 Tax=Ruditapes philippinarum TaxID=129788 RepID=UPI00295B75BB|nr:uncharacterized protein LOC132739934 isoform X1 [Ruditapes philippinarum]
MAENDNLIAELNRAWKCLDGAIKESLASKRDTLILQREDGSKILQCIEKSRMRFEEGQPSGTKKRMTSSHGKRKSVYVYMSGTRNNLTQIIEEEFSKLLSKMSITCVSLTGKEELKDKLIVLCPIYSRLQSDIQFVLKELQQFPLPGRFAIAVINMTREDSLPRLPIETRLDQPTDDYNNIHFIDMAFTKDNLMYDCNMNKTAREKIKSFVNNMYQQERSEGTCVAS